jgi:hypothetical protein
LSSTKPRNKSVLIAWPFVVAPFFIGDLHRAAWTCRPECARPKQSVLDQLFQYHRIVHAANR